MAISQNFPSVRPTLDLNFAATKRLDPRITFSRGSVGTYHDSTGTIQIAAPHVARFDHNPATGESLGLLVEEARTNLRIYSSAPNASNSYRIYGNATYNAAVVAPDGTATATLITGNGSSSGFDNYPNDYGSNGGAVQTYSFYVRNVNATSLQISMGGYGNPTYTFTFATETGVANAAASGSGFQKLSNGWYRIWLTGTKSNQFWYQQAYIDNGSATSASMYFWGGHQREAGSFPTSYIPTPATFTGRASTATFYNSSGIIQTAAAGVARSAAFFPDSNGVFRPAGLLLEAAGTNLVTYSEQFDNAAWTKSGATVTANVTTSPDGTTTADKLVENSANSGHFITQNFGNGLNPGTIYSYTVFVKASERTYCTVQMWGNSQRLGIAINLSTGAIVQTDTANTTLLSSSVIPFPNGWYRVNITGSGNTANTYGLYLAGVAVWDGVGNAVWQDGKSYQGNGTSGIFVWGAQVEQNSYATSYIPTTASTVTRAADTSTSATVTRSADVANITGTNFSSWHIQGQGTLAVQGDVTYRSSYQNYIALYGSGYASNRMALYLAPAGHRAYIDPPGISPAITGQTSGTYSLAVAYNATNGASSFNGGSSSTFNTGSISSTFTTLTLSGADDPPGLSRIKRLTYWPTRLSDATLQQITR